MSDQTVKEVDDVDEVYFDRNMLVIMSMALARLVGWQTGYLEDKSETDENWPIVYIDTPAGQISYHLSVPVRLMADMNINKYPGERDGHTTEENRKRLATAVSQLLDPKGLKILKCQHLRMHPHAPAYDSLFMMENVNDTEAIALMVCETCARAFEVIGMQDILKAGAKDWISKNYRKFKFEVTK